MNILIILIIISLLVASGFVMAFIWAVRTGQFDDTSTPSIRILLEDQAIKPSIKNKTKNSLKNQ